MQKAALNFICGKIRIPIAARLRFNQSVVSPMETPRTPNQSSIMKKRTLPLALLAFTSAVLPSCVIDPQALDALANSSRPTYYPPPQVHPYRSSSDYYSSGYYPYSTPPKTASTSSQKAHTYDVAYRVGQDDFHHNRPKHMDQHKNLFDATTHDSFRSGYEAGYDAARRNAKP
jgi:hypothetical protein